MGEVEARTEAFAALIADLRGGDRAAMGRLMTLVYDELREIAHARLRRQGPGQTLNTTALVHEAYLRFEGRPERGWNDRKHFLAVASTAMRCVLIDYARRRAAGKRGGQGLRKVTLDPARVPIEDRSAELLEIDQALERLAGIDRRLSRVVELRFFGGLSVSETAEVLETSERTVKRDWRKARALLVDLLAGGTES